MGEGRPRPTVLLVIDGFGIGPRPADDAIAAAPMPALARAARAWPHTTLDASGPAVGPARGPDGQQRGRPPQPRAPGGPCSRTSRASTPRSRTAASSTTPALLDAVRRAAEPGRRLHVMTLLGSGRGARPRPPRDRVRRSSPPARARGDVAFHLLLDGRDTPPRSADGFLADFQARLAAVAPRRARRDDRRPLLGHGPRQALGARRAPLGGDRGRARGSPPRTPRPASPRPTSGARTTSSWRPRSIAGVDGTVRDGDVVVHMNFRADRARQLTHALADRELQRLHAASAGPTDLLVVTLTEYEADLPVRGRLPAAGRDQPRRDRVRRRAGASSTSRRRRSTPT